MARIKRNHMRGYNGEGMYYVLCDVCGEKIRARDAVIQHDKFNYQNKLLVCHKDVDKTNPQSYIRTRPDRQIRSPELIRSEPEDKFKYAHTADEITAGDTSNPTGRTASAPLNLQVLENTTGYVELSWTPPDEPGSSAISGYKVERESPVGGGFSVLVANTATQGNWYQDTSVSTGTQYNYRISAINRDGAGTVSLEASITTGS